MLDLIHKPASDGYYLCRCFLYGLFFSWRIVDPTCYTWPSLGLWRTGYLAWFFLRL
ncbi:hypothetical protein BDV59DRAFT_174845 [Aspergillus ambiguus]|uniref:uncharacterized protein n=1 Tax=Aspergillus ambiguus TaxID=176160 RepID=UPI003CCE2F74